MSRSLPLGVLLSLLTLFLSSLVPFTGSASTVDFINSVSYTTDGGAQLALSDLTTAYLLIQPNVSIVGSYISQEAELVASMTEEKVDFAVFGSYLTNVQALAYPHLQMFPVMALALVPIYRLDALGLGAPPLVFSRPVLARIYLGNITWWNDSAIQNCNPGVNLPSQRITMVLPVSGTATNEIWSTALSKFYAPFNSTVSVGGTPNWPYSLYFKYIEVSGTTAQPSTVVSTDGSIGYAYLSAADQTTVNIASMINKAGITVQPTANAVTFAAVELGTTARSRTTAAMDLTDGTGSSVWPITMMSFLLIDTQYSRSTCHVRAAVVEFWLWYYSSNIALGLLGTRQYAPVPSIVLSQLSVVDQLSTAIMCRGAVALPTAVTTTRIIAAPVSVSFLSSLFAQLYSTQDPDVNWEIQQNTDGVILEQFIDGEVDIAFINPNNVDPTLMQAAYADPVILTIPVFLTADVVAYNFQITANVSASGHTLTLDMHTIGLIQWGCIFYWNDPLILSQNPWLAPLLPNVTTTPVLINQFMGCDAMANESPLEDAMLAAITEYQIANNDEGIVDCINNYPLLLWTAWYTCTSVPSMGVFYTPTEDTVPALVRGTVGAMGVLQASNDPNLGIVVITDTRDGITVNTTASLTGMAACVTDGFNDIIQWNLRDPLGLSATSHNPNCYRPTQQVVALLRSTYSSSTTDSSCDRGFDSLSFMQWFINTPTIDLLVNSVDIVRVTSLSPILLNAELEALNAVLCDDETLLVTLPVPWSLASGIRAFVMVIASLGLLGCVALASVIFRYQRHVVIRSASPLFLFLSIFGLMVLFGAGFVLVASVTTASCSALSWLVNVGLMLTFSPLFAKTWRIYRIFGRRKLSVVAISNRKLLLMVGALLGCEVVLMSVWQGLGNLQPQLNTVQTSTPTVSSVPVIASRMVVDEYVQCGVPVGSSRSMFIVICIEKVLLFIWGALMAFTTRKVSSTFNEAQGITLAIYNTLFTIGVIAPIILTIQATGDVLDLLLAFALLWISAFTAATLFGPKLMTILSKPSDEVNGDVSRLSSSTSSSGYAFMSLAALSNVIVLQGYIAALQKHLLQAESKLVQMKGTPGKMGVGRTVARVTSNSGANRPEGKGLGPDPPTNPLQQSPSIRVKRNSSEFSPHLAGDLENEIVRKMGKEIKEEGGDGGMTEESSRSISASDGKMVGTKSLAAAQAREAVTLVNASSDDKL